MSETKYFIRSLGRVVEQKEWTGLGDVIASATKAVGIKPCAGCQKRQATLNKLVPFKPVDHSPNS